VGIASAPDFTRDLMWNAFDDDMRGKLESDGIVYLDSGYEEEKIPVRREFIEDGLRHIQLDATIPVMCPVHLLQGRRDTDVPWQTAERLSNQLESNDVTISYFKDGDHRLSEPVYLAFLACALEALLARV
jgi:predicted esterase